ncbi:hypothetical protein DFH06DRAFT_1224972 [Mycena polygramma]|nr:hypothetical protein DFH06DRAFT_1224972 [Mycena polygramma]
MRPGQRIPRSSWQPSAATSTPSVPCSTLARRWPPTATRRTSRPSTGPPSTPKSPPAASCSPSARKSTPSAVTWSQPPCNGLHGAGTSTSSSCSWRTARIPPSPTRRGTTPCTSSPTRPPSCPCCISCTSPSASTRAMRRGTPRSCGRRTKAMR